MTDRSKPHGPPTPEIVRTDQLQAINDLIADLEYSMKVEKADDLRGEGIQDETELHRVLCVHMLGAFERFLRQIGRPDAVPDALTKLITALNDADRGIGNDLLTPRRRGGRPPTPSDITIIQGRVAAVQDFLMAKGWEKEKAATFIFRALGSDVVDLLRAQKDNRTPSWRTVDRWRTAVLEHSKSNIMGSGFEAMKKILVNQASEGDPTPLARKVLSILQNQIVPPARKFD